MMAHNVEATKYMRHFVTSFGGEVCQADFQFLSIDSLEFSPTLCSRCLIHAPPLPE